MDSGPPERRFYEPLFWPVTEAVFEPGEFRIPADDGGVIAALPHRAAPSAESVDLFAEVAREMSHEAGKSLLLVDHA